MKSNAELEAEIRILRELVASQAKTIETLTKLVLQPQPMPAPVYVPMPCTRPHKDEIRVYPHYPSYPSYPSYPTYPWWQVFPYTYTTCAVPSVAAAPQAGMTFQVTDFPVQHFDSINVGPVVIAAQYAMAQS